MPKLENWSVTRRPETQEQLMHFAMTGSVGTWAFALAGVVYGHQKLEDGKEITTSAVMAINVEEKWADTKSGTNYELGEINPDWVAFMNENGYKIEDYVNPILARAVEAAVNEPKN